MDQVIVAAAGYRLIRDRIGRRRPPDRRTDARRYGRGATDLHEIVAAIVRSALTDEALATGLKGRIAEMEERLDRLQDRAAKRRHGRRRHDRIGHEEDNGGGLFGLRTVPACRPWWCLMRWPYPASIGNRARPDSIDRGDE